MLLLKKSRLTLLLVVFFLTFGIGVNANESFDLPGNESFSTREIIEDSQGYSAMMEEYPIETYDIESAMWEKTFGGAGEDLGYSIQQTTDGGYIITGVYDTYGINPQIYLIKTKANGKREWQKTFGGNDWDEGRFVQQTDDGGYIIVGDTDSFGKKGQVYLIKTNMNGEKEWKKTFGGDGNDFAESVQQTSDGGYIIAGGSDSYGKDYQVYLLKTNAKGEKQWMKTFGGNDHDIGQSVRQTTDGGYIITGYTHTLSNFIQVYLIKTNANGKLQWQKTFGGAGDDRGYSVQQTSDGGYIIAGSADESFVEGIQAYLIKTNANGRMQWQKTIGSEDYESARSVQQTSDGGYIIAGPFCTHYETGYQVYVAKTNANGKLQWQKTLGGEGYEEGASVQQTSDGGYVIVGSTDSFGKGSQVYLIKLNEYKILPVPYVHQGDNKPWCTLASATMLLRYYGHDSNIWEESKYLKWHDDDGAIARVVSGWELISGWALEIKLLQEKYGYSTTGEFYTLLDPDDLYAKVKKKIDQDKPVMLSMQKFTAPLVASSWGHAVVVTGYETSSTGKKYLYIHDPSGALTQTKLGLSEYPHTNVKVPYNFFNMIKSTPADLIESKLVTIDNGIPDPKQATIQLGKSSIRAPLTLLKYSNPSGSLKKFENKNLILDMDKGLCWDIDNTDDSIRDNTNILKWQVGTLPFYVTGLRITTLESGDYTIVMYFEDKYEGRHLEISRDITIPLSGSVTESLPYGDLTTGEYRFFIKVYKDGKLVTKAVLPKIVLT